MKIAFLLYDNRSGSTLLSSLLDRYEAICVTPETDFVFSILEYPEDKIDRKNFEQFKEYIANRTRFGELSISNADFFERLKFKSNQSLEKKDLLSYFFLEYAKQASIFPEILIVKGPRLHFHINTLKSFYHKSKFVQIIRDGRAVFNSKMQTRSIVYEKGNYESKSYMDTNVVHAALSWRKKINIADNHSEIFNVYYENLLRDKELCLSDIVNFLGVSNKSVGKRVKDFNEKINQEYKTIHKNVGKGLQKDRIYKWAEELDTSYIMAYQILNKDILVKHGYTIIEFGKTNNIGYYLITKHFISMILDYIKWTIRYIFKGKIFRKLRMKIFEF